MNLQCALADIVCDFPCALLRDAYFSLLHEVLPHNMNTIIYTIPPYQK